MDGLYYREPEDVLVDNMCDDDDEQCNADTSNVEDDVIENDGTDIDRVAGLPDDENSHEKPSEKHITNKIADEVETEISGSDDSIEYDVEEDDEDDSEYGYDAEEDEDDDYFDDDDEEVF